MAVAPTASLAGGMQIVARSIETGLHKMDTLGFDVRKVVSAIGLAPLPPVAKSDMRAIGRTNDCVLYGAHARYTVRAEDDELASLAERLPSSSSADYGTPFYDIFKRYDNDFYKIDPLLFSPAEVWLTSVSSGRTYSCSVMSPSALMTSVRPSGVSAIEVRSRRGDRHARLARLGRGAAFERLNVEQRSGDLRCGCRRRFDHPRCTTGKDRCDSCYGREQSEVRSC